MKLIYLTQVFFFLSLILLLSLAILAMVNVAFGIIQEEKIKEKCIKLGYDGVEPSSIFDDKRCYRLIDSPTGIGKEKEFSGIMS